MRTNLNARDTAINSKNSLLNTFWLYGEKIISMTMVLLVHVLLARQLGPADYGTFNMLLAFLALFSPFIALGLNAIVTRELLSRENVEGEVIGTVLLLRALGMIAGTLCIGLIAILFVDKLESHLVLLCVLLVGNAFTVLNVLDQWYQAKMVSKYAAIIRTVVLFLFSFSKIIVILLYPSLMWLVIIQSLEWLILGVGYMVGYKNLKSKLDTLKVNWRYGTQLLRESIWLIFSGVAAIIYLKIDQLMLGVMVNESEVGIYSIAVKFSEIWYFFPTALAASFFPKLLKDRELDSQRYQNILQLLIDSMFLFALVVSIATLVCSGVVIPYIFGSEYERSVSLLNIQIWASCFVFMRAITSKWLIAESLVKFSLVSQGAGAICNVLLNLTFIPEYGAVGAAWATLISYSVASYFCFWLFSDTRVMAVKMTKVLTIPFRLGQFKADVKAAF